jgi:hypothetical protein
MSSFQRPTARNHILNEFNAVYQPTARLRILHPMWLVLRPSRVNLKHAIQTRDIVHGLPAGEREQVTKKRAIGLTAAPTTFAFFVVMPRLTDTKEQAIAAHVEAVGEKHQKCDPHAPVRRLRDRTQHPGE